MKLSTGLGIMKSRNLEKKLSKKIVLANTAEHVISKEAQKKAQSVSSNPIYFSNVPQSTPFNPDIRYRYSFVHSPLTDINYRNELLIFAENKEVAKAVNIVANEVVIMESEHNKYPVFPEVKIDLFEQEKQEIGIKIQDYLDKVFYPKLFKWYNLKEEGLIELVEEYLKTGKICYEIIYDSLTAPKDIIGIQPLDPSTLQKFKNNDTIYYVQRTVNAIGGGSSERILHENQVILIEWNEYDFGYVSYVDGLQRPFNIMRSMQTSKALWFAAKSQLRMHIKFGMGDIPREVAEQRLSTAKEDYITQLKFEDNGTITFNGEPNNIGYREIFTAETTQSGSPEIEEINANGPDLTETDSLNYWSKLFWLETEIPYDRIDPQSTETWGFADVNNLRKVEINFGKFINKIRKQLNPLFLKPIIIQLTLKEVEIGVDLSILDAIKMKWIAFNQYEMMAELEVLAKRVELAQNISNFGDYTDANERQRKAIPLLWIIKNYLDFSKEQLDSIELDRIRENVMLGFNPDGSLPDNVMQEGGEGVAMPIEEEPIEEEPSEQESNEVPEIINMIQLGEITEEEIKMLIDDNALNDDEIEALKQYNLYPVESAEDIAASDDKNF